jgi:hypothetical protein
MYSHAYFFLFITLLLRSLHSSTEMSWQLFGQVKTNKHANDDHEHQDPEQPADSSFETRLALLRFKPGIWRLSHSSSSVSRHSDWEMNTLTRHMKCLQLQPSMMEVEYNHWHRSLMQKGMQSVRVFLVVDDELQWRSVARRMGQWWSPSPDFPRWIKGCLKGWCVCYLKRMCCLFNVWIRCEWLE